MGPTRQEIEEAIEVYLFSGKCINRLEPDRTESKTFVGMRGTCAFENDDTVSHRDDSIQFGVVQV